MAEGGEMMEKTMEELEKDITCAICLGHYTEPKVLPCLHYYCKDCIQTLALRKGIDKPFSCPECRTGTTLPQGGVASLKPAFFINRMKDVHSKLSLAQGKVEAVCESCSGDKAEAFCRQCTQFICTECVKQHKRMKIFTGHKTVSLQELREGGAKEIMFEEHPLQTCPVHDEKMKIYCFDCKCLICRDCTVDDHSGHRREFIKKSVPKVKRELLEQLDPLKEVKVGLLCAVDEIQATKSEVEDQVVAVTANIESSFDNLQRILAHRKQQLIKEAEALATEKLEHLSGQEKKVSMSCAVVQSVIEYTEQFIGHSANDEIMCMHAEIQSRIKREIEERKTDELDPVEEVDIGVEVTCTEDLKQLCRTKAKLIQLDTAVTVAGVGVQSAMVDEGAEIRVTAVLNDGKQVKRRNVVPFECHLKSLVNGSTTKCKVDRTDNEYCSRYTPTVRGRHEIHLSAPGYEVLHSPIPIFVSIHPTKLVTPVRVINGRDRLYHTSINSAGEIVASELDSVIVLNKEGVKVSYTKFREKHNVNPLDLVTDGDDNVYISGANSNNGKLIKLKLIQS